MKYLLLITLIATSACSSWGNSPAQQFANVTYSEDYIQEMVRTRVQACRNNPDFCEELNAKPVEGYSYRSL
jgi:hypothetical protein